MKLQLIFLCAFAFTWISAESTAISERAVSCKTVLSPELCSKLKVIVKHLKVVPTTLQKAIQAAIAAGETSGPALYKRILVFLRDTVAGRECEKFLAERLCKKIRDTLTPFNLAKLAGKLVIESILTGPPTKYQIFLRVLNAVRKEVAGKSCDEVLAPEICNKLREIAIKLSIKAANVSIYVVEAVIAGNNSPKDIYQAALKFFRDQVRSLNCTDILSNEACSSLNGLGRIFNISSHEIAEAVKEAILRGNVLVKDITKEVKNYITKVAKETKCEDLVSAELCSKLKAIAGELKIGANLVDEAVREAISTGKLDLEDIKKFCVEFFKEHVTCEPWLGAKTCAYIRTLATSFGVKLKEVEAKLRDLIANHQTKATEIFKEIIRFIKNTILG